ncbi:hypothetical protein [uncultured Brevundimonas sp.]|uniref:hypothetical protein n=1 Tax=uncultured Brevundimonas sp. TaxID=213418 RepID=UPI002606DECF|nr:hypothetical protein [uncultured Brevundimonas sp.]
MLDSKSKAILLATAVVTAAGTVSTAVAQDQVRQQPLSGQAADLHYNAILETRSPSDIPRFSVPPRLPESARPQRAVRENVNGAATLICGASPDGVIRACNVESETPEGYGFGEAAKVALYSARLIPQESGDRVFRIRLPIRTH